MRCWLSFLVLMLVSPFAFASASSGSIILIYDRSGRDGFASRVTEALQPVLGDSDVWVCDDAEVFNSIAFLPQVRMLILLMNRQAVSLNTEAVEWFFRQGGSVLGNFGAGIEQDSGRMASDVFPVYANATTTAAFNRQTRRYEMTYVRKDEHEVTEDLPNRFAAPEGRMVVRWNARVREPVRILPVTGKVSDLYVEESNGFPLVVLYEDEGQSAFFSSLDPRSENLSELFEDANYSKLLSNVAEWLLGQDRKSSHYNVSMLNLVVSRLSAERLEARETAESMRRRQMWFRLSFDVVVVVFSAAGVWLVYRYFIRVEGSEEL